MLKRIFISIGILVAVCLGGFITYTVAYAVGETAGYDKGYSSGQDVGYSLGKEDGYELGKDEGYGSGYTSGKAEGYDEGIQVGLGQGYTLRDPTYAEALAFIQEDRTSENQYVEPTYVCSHFCRDVCNNADQKGLRCACVDLRYPDSAHAIVAFDTSDQGLVYFDAITDERARPVVGQRYYQCIEPMPGYYYAPPPFDDTIMDILVIW